MPASKLLVGFGGMASDVPKPLGTSRFWQTHYYMLHVAGSQAAENAFSFKHAGRLLLLRYAS